MRLIFLFLSVLLLSFSSNAQEVVEGNLLAQWNKDGIPGSFTYDNAYNEIWGLAVNGYEYAVIGSSLGTHFIDVTDTDDVYEAFFVEGRAAGGAIIHRDYHDNDGYLYAVSDEGNSSLQIIDVRSLPDSISVVYDEDDLIRTSHNIFIDEDNDRLYSCAHRGFVTGNSALRVLDISDPLNPVDILGTNTFENFGVGHVHDAYVKDNIGYLNCGRDGFALVDFTDIDSLQLLGFLEPDDYPDSGYNHSGWLSEQEDIYYMADEDHGRAIKTIDVTDYTELETVSTFDEGMNISNSIPHNLIVQGDYLYVSYYYNGLQVYDIQDRENPKRIMHYPTSSIPNGNSYEGAWGVYPFLPSGNILVSDMQEGLFVVEGVSSIVSNNEVVAEVFTIYPNPVTDFIQIQLEEEGNYDYRIKNISGQVIQKGEINSLKSSLTIEAIPSGTYFIELNNEKQIFAQKFVVTK